MSSVVRELPLTAVVLVVAAGLLLGAVGSWRLGALLVGLGLLLGGVLRAVLRRRSAGLLAVRSRRADAAVLLGLGAALVVLALSVPVP